LLNAIAVTYIGRIAWQAFLFVRTDFYYTIATALNCKSLMTDTQHFIENLLARLRRGRLVDQSGIPKGERWAVRIFSLFWLVGRFFALMLLVTVTIPVLIYYFQTCWDYLTNPATAWSAFDFATAVLVATAVTTLGIVLWIRTLFLGSRRRWQEYRAWKAENRKEAPATV
jgi:hypothetical protein